MILRVSQVIRFGGKLADARAAADAMAAAIGRDRCTVGIRTVTINCPVPVHFPKDPAPVRPDRATHPE